MARTFRRDLSSSVSGNEVRSKFLAFFAKHQANPHRVVGSAPLLPPLNEPSLMFVNAGMNAWKNYLVGGIGAGVIGQDRGVPPHNMVANSQKCVRMNDLEVNLN